MDETNNKDGLTYSDRKVQINPGHPLYEWCSYLYYNYLV